MRSIFYLALPVVLLLGCGGGGDTDSVHGTVKMDDKPLEKARVHFIPEKGKGRPATGITDSEGYYELLYSSSQSGAQSGKYTVRITTGEAARESDDGETIAAVPETVPAKYNSETTLKFEVVAGENNEANFDLKSGGKIEKVATTLDDE